LQQVRDELKSSRHTTYSAVAGGSMLISGALLVGEFAMTGGAVTVVGALLLLRSWPHAD